jgi:dTDP-4-amino-4,6-dideoxygalactose transaminase
MLENISSMPSAITWCPFKPWDHDKFRRILQPSLDMRRLTNGGPLQDELARKLQEFTGSSRRAIPAANGTAALHALAAGWSIKMGRPLRWATQAFTFPSAMQGPLADSIVVDQDLDLGGPSLTELEQFINEIDGVIVTNPFGLQTAISTYEAWCKENGLLLLFDNAASAVGFFDGRRCIHDAGDGAFVSLHETKPIGRGEGGAVFVAEDLYPHVWRAMNFGFSPAGNAGVCREGNRACSNWRMSDIAAAGILCHLSTVIDCNWTAQYTGLLSYAANAAANFGLSLQPAGGLRMSKPTIVPCIFINVPHHWHGKVSDLIEQMTSLPAPIEAKQYYRPLNDAAASPRAWQIFNSTICLPLHVDMSHDDVNYMLAQVALAFASGECNRRPLSGAPPTPRTIG